ncbi:MAG: cold shock domain-containing protein, partial [Methylocystis sp.]|nr:cold shock domain-containing protein [Methylocystis sp.]
MLLISEGSWSVGAKVTFQDELDAAAGSADSEEAALDLVEVAGRIKWFDVAKGYGFVVPDDGSADILLHVTVLRRSGMQTAFEGARIVCEAQNRSKGMQVFR